MTTMKHCVSWKKTWLWWRTRTTWSWVRSASSRTWCTCKCSWLITGDSLLQSIMIIQISKTSLFRMRTSMMRLSWEIWINTDCPEWAASWKNCWKMWGRSMRIRKCSWMLRPYLPSWKRVKVSTRIWNNTSSSKRSVSVRQVTALKTPISSVDKCYLTVN